MKLRYSKPAARDLDHILSYIAKRSPRGAHLEHPLAGQQTSRADTRRLVVHPFPYLIFYRVSADEIIIRAIRHAARDPKSMPSADGC